MDVSGSLTCVVVAVDGSEVSMEALKWALDNLKLSSSSPDSSSSFVVLHVQPSPSIAAGVNPGAIPFGGPSDVEVPAFAAAIEQHQKRITDAILEHARQIYADRSVNVKTQVVVGDPKDKICETVENLNADLLVLGSRAYGPIKRMFLGSVSNYCTNHAQCPVVIIKPKEDSPE
ncbi:Adenine nucleotide alpha hydrolases-like superfamily protein [Raphanus sativus]|uniref:Universal stress protein PHOS34 n=1 Tax=Raphanus sativus TaxID=3726 RepID=A0A6J0KTD5_RAPSA|nr:universal stress protein PHOS34 [Raphanus sativus]XP_018460025.1 universal stress protein PHOS34 [Raphanus sativus]KAJ4873293.1 Adenine nucleotide alpha hydrolases-like superfamily protein [Raphanus sativus]KAJ4879082.1 Adenine nucleotide alpha hydrolases-like superfamily protein [Raphanus sativus]